MTNDRKRLLSLGVPLTLPDGSEVRVRYGFRELAAVEDRFGSVLGMQEQIGEVLADAEGSSKSFTIIGDALICGIKNASPDLVDLLEPTKRLEYIGVISEALAEAFPLPQVDEVTASEPATAESLGASTTTLQPSNTAEAK